MLTSVTLSFSPGLAVISVTLNFIVSLPVISMARPSWTCVAGARRRGDGAGAAGAVAPDSPAGGAEQPAPRVAMRRARSAKYRVMDILPAVQSRPATAGRVFVAEQQPGGRVPGTGRRESGAGRESGVGNRESGLGRCESRRRTRRLASNADSVVCAGAKTRRAARADSGHDDQTTARRAAGGDDDDGGRGAHATGGAGRERAQTFAVTGVVTAAPADGRVMVAHEDIAGYMPAMTMPFALVPGEPRAGPDAGRSRPVHAAGRRRRRARDGVRGASGATKRWPRPCAARRTAASSRLRKGDAVPDVSLLTRGRPAVHARATCRATSPP